MSGPQYRSRAPRMARSRVPAGVNGSHDSTAGGRRRHGNSMTGPLAATVDSADLHPDRLLLGCRAVAEPCLDSVEQRAEPGL